MQAISTPLKYPLAEFSDCSLIKFFTFYSKDLQDSVYDIQEELDAPSEDTGEHPITTGYILTASWF